MLEILKSIKDYKEKGLRLNIASDISIKDRDKLNLFKRDLDKLSVKFFNRIKDDPKIIDVINNFNEELDILEEVYDIFEEDIYEMAKISERQEFILDVINKYNNKHDCYKQLPRAVIKQEIIAYSLFNSYAKKQITKKDINTVLSNLNNYLHKKYNQISFSRKPIFLKDEKIKNILRNNSFMKNKFINNLVDYYDEFLILSEKKGSEYLFNFYSTILENIDGSEDSVFSKNLIKNTFNYLNSFDTEEEFEKGLDDLLELSKYPIAKIWLRFLDNYAFDKKEICTLLYKAKEGITIENPISVLYNNEILTKLSTQLTTHTKSQVHLKFNAIKRNLKKKAFIKLINANVDLIINGEPSLLENKLFGEIVNFNTLNQSNLEKICSMNFYAHQMLDDCPKNITFNEFMYLYDVYINSGRDSEINSLIFKKLNCKIDYKLKVLRQLPIMSVNNFKIMFSKEMENEKAEEILVDSISKLIMEKPFMDRVKELRPLKRCNKISYLMYLLNEKKLSPYYSEFNCGNDITFALQNVDLLKQFVTLTKAKEFLYQKDSGCKNLIKTLNVNDEFMQKNLSNILDFCDKDLHVVYNGLLNNRKIDNNGKSNLKLLVKAEILGKLKDIKFRDEDFEKEIGLEISQGQKNLWKFDKSTKSGKYTISETFKFEDIIRLGEFPVETCQHWRFGSYSQSLLSNFDTNKKMIIVQNEDGKINTRCLLRLTKGSSKYICKEKSKLTFQDVEQELASTVDYKEKKTTEELVLFLEKPYSSLDRSYLPKIKEDIIILALDKAKELGAKLFISKYYDDYIVKNAIKKSKYASEYSNIQSKQYYVFISYSKNGSQYIDSLGGSHNSNSEGLYNAAQGFIL